MADNNNKNLMIAMLSASLVLQIVTLAFLWKPEWFKDTVGKLNELVKSGSDKVKGVIKRDKDDDPAGA